MQGKLILQYGNRCVSILMGVGDIWSVTLHVPVMCGDVNRGVIMGKIVWEKLHVGEYLSGTLPSKV